MISVYGPNGVRISHRYAARKYCPQCSGKRNAGNRDLPMKEKAATNGRAGRELGTLRRRIAELEEAEAKLKRAYVLLPVQSLRGTL